MAKKKATKAQSYVKKEMHKRKHKGGKKMSKKQAIAIGLSEARQHGSTYPKKKKASKKKASKKKTSKKKSTKRKSK